MKESPIFTRSYDLMAWLIPQTLNFPKSQRGVLARRLQDTACAFHEQLVEASHADDPRPVLRHADATLTKLRTYLRLSQELRLLSLRQYEHAAHLTDEIGRLLGGWQRKLTRER